MSKVKGGCGGKSKGGKSSVKGTGSEEVFSRSESLKTSNNSNVVTLLRHALRNDDGTDKDLLSDFPSFTTFKRNGLNLSIDFRCGKQLDKADAKACFEMTKSHMEDEYNSSGYGWDDDDKWNEITSKESRLLLLVDTTAEGRACIGFVNFRFTLQGECWNAMEGAPCLFIYDLQLLPGYRRKGVGKQLLLTLEMMAKRAKLSYICALHTVHNEQGAAFFRTMKGWQDDTASLMEMEAADQEDESFRVCAKCLDTSVLKEKAQTQQVQELAMQLAALAQAKQPEPAKLTAREVQTAPTPEPVAQEKDPQASEGGKQGDAGEAAGEGQGGGAKSKNAKKKAKAKARKAEQDGGKQTGTPPLTEDIDQEQPSVSTPVAVTPEHTTTAEEEALSAAPTAEHVAEVAFAQKGTSPGVEDVSKKLSFDLSGLPKHSPSAGLFAGIPKKPEDRPVKPAAVAATFSFGLPATLPQEEASDEEADEDDDDEAEGEDRGGEDEAEEPLDDIDRVLEELCEMFEQQNGREPTEEEIKMWVATMKDANLAEELAHPQVEPQAVSVD